jgi:hypothetical protein
MRELRLLTLDDLEAWRSVLGSIERHDVYHIPEYYLASRDILEGEPMLFVYSEGGRHAALPVLLRPIELGGGTGGAVYRDATSVYGYPGAVTNVAQRTPEAREFREGFQDSLRMVFDDLGIVSFFSRTNPLIETNWLFEGMTEPCLLGQTVGVDLCLDDDHPLCRTSTNHRRNFNKAVRQGVRCFADQEGETLGQFIEIYEETMRRVNAKGEYVFPHSHYEDLLMNLGHRVCLFYALYNGVIISSCMFFLCNGIAQYHLGGTRTEHLDLSPMRAIFDYVKTWSRDRGFSWIHLGGGVGARQDSLFRFKAGMSGLRLDYYVLKYIRNPPVYRELVRLRGEAAGPARDADYFPLYRA